MDMMNYDYDKESYKEMKRVEKAEVFELLNEETEVLVKDNDKYIKYLDTQANLDSYSVSNAILVSAKIVGASKLRTFDEWKDMNYSIKRGEKKIPILKPYNYEREDGSIGTDYRVEKVFDISQTNVIPRKSRFSAGITTRGLLKALINESPVLIEVSDLVENDRNAVYDNQEKKILVKKDLSPDLFFKDVSLALAHAEFAVQDQKYDKDIYAERAKAVSYMLCKRYDIDPGNIQITVPESYKDMEPKEIRQDLSENREVFKSINERMRESIIQQKETEKDKDKER